MTLPLSLVQIPCPLTLELDSFSDARSRRGGWNISTPQVEKTLNLHFRRFECTYGVPLANLTVCETLL